VKTVSLDRLRTAAAPLEQEYQPFPNESRRNWTQQRFEIPAMIKALGLPRGGRVLEIGCGCGVALPVFARLLSPVRLVGLDLDAALLSVAGSRLGETRTVAELIPGDVRSLPFPAASFDLVIDFGTCFHIGHAGRALRQIARVLAPGGVFACETKLSQLLSHPVRSWGRRNPVSSASLLKPLRHALLWRSFRRNYV
jgi:ubiquinone/menaquinone biosynthesis C-methylase UbiE